MKRVTTVFFMILIIAALAACGAENTEENTSTSLDGNDEEVAGIIEITHEASEEPVVIKENPQNAVVFDFGILDTLDELGIEIAGLPQATVPAYLKEYEDSKYENVGTLKEPDFEAIHALQPDVIFISDRQLDLYDEFSEIAPTVFVGIDHENYMDSFKGNMDIVATIFDKKDEINEQLAEIDNRIEALHEQVLENNERALIVLGSEGKVSAYGPSSRFGIIHDVFGFEPADENIEVSTHGQSISFEYILETNPSILFVVDRDAAIGGEASAKETIENDLVMKTAAYENDQIIYLDADYWYLSGGGLQSVKAMIAEIEEIVQ